MKFTVAELRPLAILEGLPEEQLVWFSDHGTRIDLAAGDRMFERGQPADFMFIVVTGTIQRYEEIGGQWLVGATTRRGQVTGMLPYSRMSHYPGPTIAAEPSQVLRVSKTAFPDMLAASPEVGQRLVAEMADRVRGDVRLEQQREKLMALGSLSAGLAHELNNPAAAVLRTASSLSDQLRRQAVLVLSMLRRDVTGAEIAALNHLMRLADERGSADISPLDRSAGEDDLTAWLEHHAVDDAWEHAGTFVDMGLGVEDLADVARTIPAGTLGAVLTYVAGQVGAERMIAQIASSAKRISELVSSIKIYSHMDRSSEHKPTDVREGIDNTLIMFGHKLKQKNIQLIREYQDDLPAIPANAGELNQVWTNLIDNAIDVMADGGELRVLVRSDPWCVDVGIIDDGPGIPDAIRARIFDPFFTTKAMGDGTGLGLDIARRIVATHQGQIDVRSRPGRTELSVRLPIAPALPEGRHDTAGPRGRGEDPNGEARNPDR